MDFSFDASNVSSGSDARIKAGEKYIFICVQAELKQTRAGDGSYINTRFEIADGPCKGKTIYGRYTYQNKSTKAVEIGHKQLAEYCVAIGKQKISDIVQLEGVAFIATVKEVESFYNGETKKNFEVEKPEACDEQTRSRIAKELAEAATVRSSDDQAPF